MAKINLEKKDMKKKLSMHKFQLPTVRLCQCLWSIFRSLSDKYEGQVFKKVNSSHDQYPVFAHNHGYITVKKEITICVLYGTMIWEYWIGQIGMCIRLRTCVPDLHLIGSPGSGSALNWLSWIRIRNELALLDLDPHWQYGSVSDPLVMKLSKSLSCCWSLTFQIWFGISTFFKNKFCLSL